MKIGLVQYDPLWQEVEKNKNKILHLLDNTSKNLHLLIFPEMTLTGFTMEAQKFAEDTVGNSAEYFSDIAKQSGTNIVAGVIEKEDNKIFNAIWYFDKSGKLISKYHKIHPFSYSEEDKNYSRGTSPVIVNVEGITAGLSVCYDLRFPELFRIYGKQKAELLIIIANWPVTRIEHWRTLLKARAIENQCYVAGVNRIGNDPKSNYNGFSSVYDPMGKELITSENKEEILIAEIQTELVKEVRNKLPFLNDIYLI